MTSPADVTLSKTLSWLLRHGAMAPPLIDRSVSGMTSSGSTSNVVPKPSQVSQAP